MTAQIVVIVGIRHDRRARWIECDLEVIGQVSIRSTTYDEARLGNVRRMRNVIARDRLAERRCPEHVRAQGVKHMPVRGINPRRSFVGSVPNYSDSPSRPRGHPRENSRLSFGAIAYTKSWTPSSALVF